MIPDIACIWVSFFLAQRPSSAPFLLARRCRSTWRNAPFSFLVSKGCGDFLEAFEHSLARAAEVEADPSGPTKEGAIG